MDSDHTAVSCPFQSADCRRRRCRPCDNAYMRAYQRRRRREEPEAALMERARIRSRRQCLRYSLSRSDIHIPRNCPALGIPLRIGGSRSDRSPSLDRICPSKGYIPGNVRVLSDRANRIKGQRNLHQVRLLAVTGSPALREDYRMIADYLERESLLAEVRERAAAGGRTGEEWAKIAVFLDRVFSGRNLP